MDNGLLNYVRQEFACAEEELKKRFGGITVRKIDTAVIGYFIDGKNTDSWERMQETQGEERFGEWFYSVHTHAVNALGLGYIMQADISGCETPKKDNGEFRLPLFGEAEIPYWYRRACEDIIAVFAASAGKYDFIPEGRGERRILSGFDGYANTDILDVNLCERFRELYDLNNDLLFKIAEGGTYRVYSLKRYDGYGYASLPSIGKAPLRDAASLDVRKIIRKFVELGKTLQGHTDAFKMANAMAQTFYADPTCNFLGLVGSLEKGGPGRVVYPQNVPFPLDKNEFSLYRSSAVKLVELFYFAGLLDKSERAAYIYGITQNCFEPNVFATIIREMPDTVIETLEKADLYACVALHVKTTLFSVKAQPHTVSGLGTLRSVWDDMKENRMYVYCDGNSCQFKKKQ